MTTKLKSWMLPVVALLLLLLLLGSFAGLFSSKIPPGITTTPLADNSQALQIHTLSVPIVEPVPASVEAKQATIISSRIMAKISSISVRAGDSVVEGQALIELEKSDLWARAQQSKEQARSIAARLDQVQKSLNRSEKLRAEGLIAEAELDTARANSAALEADLAAAMQAQEEAETALSFSEIRSPINGRVVDRFAEPGDTATPGTRLLTLYNPLSLRIEAHVREQLALSLRIGQAVAVEIPSLGMNLAAEVEERVPAADSGSRSLLVKVRVPYVSALLPGMYARLLVPAGIESQLRIPIDHVAKVGQLNVVWVVDSGRIQRRFVRLGRTFDDGNVQITSGLSNGDYLLPVQISQLH